ncbi:MAG: hypothetical protein K6B28_12335 [Lachnospiraceae bacterium]|nr:hypothetical protein [Lachnospiraceae bacterium]
MATRSAKPVVKKAAAKEAPAKATAIKQAAPKAKAVKPVAVKAEAVKETPAREAAVTSVIAAPDEEVLKKIVYQSSAEILERDAKPNESFGIGDDMPVYYL